MSDTSGHVRSLDARSLRVRWIANVGGYPDTLVVDRESLWVGIAATQTGAPNGSVVRVSSATGRRLGEPILVGTREPLRLAAGGRTIWLVNSVDRRIWRLDARSGAIKGATIIASGAWDSATIAADARGAWVASYSVAAGSQLVHIDAQGHIIARRRFHGVNIDSLAIDRSTLLATAGSARGLLLRLDSRTGQTKAPAVHVGRSPIAVALGQRGVWVASIDEPRALRRININTGEITAGPYRAPGRSGRVDDLVATGGFLWTINAYGIASQLSGFGVDLAVKSIDIP